MSLHHTVQLGLQLVDSIVLLIKSLTDEDCNLLAICLSKPFFCSVSRTERSGRYGSIIDREDRDERDTRSRRRDSSDYKRSIEERRSDRYDDYHDYDSRDYDGRDYDSPEVSDRAAHMVGCQ